GVSRRRGAADAGLQRSQRAHRGRPAIAGACRAFTAKASGHHRRHRRRVDRRDGLRQRRRIRLPAAAPGRAEAALPRCADQRAQQGRAAADDAGDDHRFPGDVYALSPTLVIWETGTFDAARGVDLDVFASALESGLADLREHKLETMLINMQYSRNTASVINFVPYLETMQHIADVDGVYLFRRFEMMKYWAENGVFSFGEVPVERRTELARQVYQCLADRLADAIAYAVMPQ